MTLLACVVFFCGFGGGGSNEMTLLACVVFLGFSFVVCRNASPSGSREEEANHLRKGGSGTTNPTTDNEITRLTHWLHKLGHDDCNLQLKRFSPNGSNAVDAAAAVYSGRYGIVAGPKGVKKGSVIVRVPKKAFMTGEVRNPLAAACPSHLLLKISPLNELKLRVMKLNDVDDVVLPPCMYVCVHADSSSLSRCWTFGEASKANIMASHILAFTL